MSPTDELKEEEKIMRLFDRETKEKLNEAILKGDKDAAAKIMDAAINDAIDNDKEMIIYSPKVARPLIKKGYQIVDIKPDRNDKFHKKTVFVFKIDGNFMDDFKAITDEIKAGQSEESEAQA